MGCREGWCNKLRSCLDRGWREAGESRTCDFACYSSANYI